MTDYPNDADGDALRRVVASGADMSRPMEIDFSVAMPDEPSAQQVADTARQLGYRVKVVYEADESEDDAVVDGQGAQLAWTCYCTKTLLATYEGVVSAQFELERISSPLGGHCDGWGTFGNS